MKKLLVASLIIIVLSKCKNNDSSGNDSVVETSANAVAAPANITYNIVAKYPHDTGSYTQGLIVVNNTMYEGTGLEGFSKLMKVDLKTGKPLQTVPLANTIFGEGITILNNKIYQLTWKNQKVFVYDAQTFKKLQEFDWPYEGWGITHNGKELIVSTGSSNLYFVDPGTFKVNRIVGVVDNNGPVGNLNELEYIDGKVYANVYQSDYIVKVDPENGHVIGKMDLSGMLQKNGVSYNPETTDVLNGIAYDISKKSFYITGKKWPAMFEVKVN